MTVEEIKALVNQRIVENYTGDITAEDVNTAFNETLDLLRDQEHKVTEIEKKSPSVAPNDDDVDLTIEDEAGNACLEVAKGEVRTGNFDSNTAVTSDEIENPTHTGAKEPVYAVSDYNGNHVLEVGKDGHIRTRAFDSSTGGGGGSTSGHPLSGKTLVMVGDSQVGDTSNLDTIIMSKLPLKNAYRCGFSGSWMSYRTKGGVASAYDAYGMHSIADAIASGNYSLQEANIQLIEHLEQTKYVPSIDKLKSINWGDGKDIILTIQYGGNDWNNSRPIGSIGDGIGSLKGALSYSIETLLTAMPKLKIILIGHPYAVTSKDEAGNILTDSDTKPNAIGLYRYDYQDAVGEVAKFYHYRFMICTVFVAETNIIPSNLRATESTGIPHSGMKHSLIFIVKF